MKRGMFTTLSLFALLSILLLPSIYAGDYITNLDPGVLHDAPGTVMLIYSAPVTIDSAILFTADGLLVPDYDPQTSPTGTNDTFTLTTGLIPEGDYKLEVAKSSGKPPYAALTADVVPFEYDRPTFSVDVNLNGSINKLLATPSGNSPSGVAVLQTGFAATGPFAAEFTTTKPAACKYSLSHTTNHTYMGDFQETGTFPDALLHTHRITGLTSKEYGIVSVYCKTEDDENPEVLKWFTLGYEDTAPSFTSELDPPLLVDPNNLRTNITITATPSQKMYCEAVGNGLIATSMGHYDVILNSGDAGAYEYFPWIDLILFTSYEERTELDFNITCTNRAGLSSSEEVSIIIDPTIEPSLAMETPGRYTREISPVFGVKAVRESFPVRSDPCVFTDGTALSLTADDNNVVWSADLGGIVDGDYEYSVECNIGGGILVDETFEITVDRTPPPTPGLWVPEHLCEDPLYVELNLSKYDLPDTNFDGYKFNITYATGNIVLEEGHDQGGDTTELLSSIATETNETYHWHIWPVDLAGNKASELTGSTLMMEPGDKLCDHENPTAWLEINESDTGTTVLVKCEDDESGCADTFKYDRLGVNETPDMCSYAKTETLNRTLTFFEEGSLCYKVFDLNDNEDTGFRVIEVDEDIPTAEEHCDNGVLDAGLETDIDCGGQCDACEVDEKCVVGTDCATDYCGEGNTCEEKGTCTDAIKNGYESDIDCGGADCPTCSDGQTCKSTGDCQSSYCDAAGQCGEKPKPEVECTSDTDCDFGKICENTYCKTPPATKCESDADCAFGEECDIYGECNTVNEDDKASLLGIILIILGLLIMAGAGYWLYMLHEERESERQQAVAASQSTYRQRPQEMTPAQRIALQKQRQQQLEAIKKRKALGKQRLAEKSKKRTGLADAFGDEEAPTEESSEVATGDKKPQGKKLDEGESEDFVDVRDLGKKEKKFTKKAQPTKEPIKKTDSFDELDDIVGKKGKDNTFKELDEVIDDEKDKKEGKKDAK
ncbi:hypothetical protein GOV07_04465 [Candidatus Woesearchaeota archaeon]|nr:hypothetical protein [Candidatus Woesearchaeota archaeon]